MTHLQVSCFSILFTLGLSAASHAAILEFTWGEVEVVDTEVDDFTFSSGQNAIHPLELQSDSDSLWYVAYAKNDEIYLGLHGPSGWLAPLQVTNDPAPSRQPCIAEIGGGVGVVWEDDRSGHTEIWTRTWNGSSWTAEVCLSLDAIPSRAPSFDADAARGIVAWQDEPSGQPIYVVARLLENGIWSPASTLSASTADAFEPSVSLGRLFAMYTVVWSDRRHGEAELYGRDKAVGGGAFFPEERLTNMVGECRRPSVADRPCCLDFINPERLVAFENYSSGVSEVWGVCYQSDADTPVAISALDGIASHAPRASGRDFDWSVLHFGGPTPRYSVTWSDSQEGDATLVRIAELTPCSQQSGAEVVSVAGLGGSAVGGCSAQGEEEPLARVLVVWPELREGSRALLSREATAIGCQQTLPTAPSALLLTPVGSPTNQVDVLDVCTGGPAPGGAWFRLDMSNALRNALTWDPAFPKPPLDRDYHGGGFVTFDLHGGGCSQAGTATLKGNGLTFWIWPGAKSPDVDGDCAVRGDDLAYVQSQLGTNDFCADLDGSDLVDATDVAIVEVTFNDHCTNATDVASAISSPSLLLRVGPNPMRSTGILRYDLPAAERVTLSIFDVAGREVRSWPSLASGAGMNLIPFDGRGDDGRDLPAGWYLARVTTSAGSITQPFVRLD